MNFRFSKVMVTKNFEDVKENTLKGQFYTRAVLEEPNFVLNKKDLVASPRIGVDYAGEDARLPYRFYIKGNPFVSGKPK